MVPNSAPRDYRKMADLPILTPALAQVGKKESPA
jgi:hypothetical protein